MTQFDLQNCFSNEDLEREYNLLCQPWSDSPFIHFDKNDIITKEKEYYEHFFSLLNDSKSFLSPLGRLFQSIKFKNQSNNRYTFFLDRVYFILF